MPSRPDPRRRILAAALALVLGGCAGAVDNPERPNPPSAMLPLRGARPREVGWPRRPRAGSFDAPAVVPRVPGFEVGALPRRVAASQMAPPPVRLEIPAIGVAARLGRLGLETGGGLAIPVGFATAGWFAGGPRPGQLGPAVIAGHVDSRTGPAVFFRLRELRSGDVVLVDRADGAWLRFVVGGARSFSKAEFPTAAVFWPVPSAALRLIPCAGDFAPAGGHYLDNLVVFARLAA